MMTVCDARCRRPELKKKQTKNKLQRCMQLLQIIFLSLSPSLSFSLSVSLLSLPSLSLSRLSHPPTLSVSLSLFSLSRLSHPPTLSVSLSLFSLSRLSHPPTLSVSLSLCSLSRLSLSLLSPVSHTLPPSLSLSSISVIDIYCFRVALTQLRLGVLPINSNMYRYSDCPTKKKKKKKEGKKRRRSVFCQNQVENEDHFLLVCPLYTDLRYRFLEQKGIQSLQNMLRRKNTKGCRLLSKFIFHAIKRRKLYVDV